MTTSLLAAVLSGGVLWSLLRVVRRREIRLTPSLAAAVFPWFGVVGATYAVEEARHWPAWLAVFTSAPTAYLTVGAVVLGLWLAVDQLDPGTQPSVTAGLGSGILLAVGAWVVLSGQRDVVLWNAVAVVSAVLLTAVAVTALRRTETIAASGLVGASVLFAHVLDATTTGVGLRVLGASERNPVAAAVIELGSGSPVAGSGALLFLAVKATVALAVVTVVVGDDEPLDAGSTAILVLAGGVGLAPAVHNLVLFGLQFG